MSDEALRRFISARTSHALDRRSSTHAWTTSVRRGTPVMACTECPVVWWPDRHEPRGTCVDPALRVKR
jgi:hypothetical protein